MFTRSLKLLFATLLLMPLAALAEGTIASGTIAKTGYGKFVLKESDGLERLYVVGKKDTTYDPGDWRPGSGDQVKIDFYQKKDKLVASRIQLVKLGPNSVDPKQMISPMRVIVRESGKSGIIATLKGTTKQTKFSYQRKKTQYEPVGWVPASGEEVEVEFTSTAATFTYNMAYVLTKITRIK